MALQSLKEAEFRHVDLKDTVVEAPTPGNSFRDAIADAPLTSIAANIAGFVVGLMFLPVAIVAGVPAPDLRRLDDDQTSHATGAILKVQCTGLDRLETLTRILEESGARDIAASLNAVDDGPIGERLVMMSKQEDLQRRVYRDIDGNIHHHTRTFLDQHPAEEALA